MANNHKAVDALSDILNRLPAEQRDNLVFFACLNVGLSLESTGLKPTKERQLRHLHWGFTLDDLERRLVQLIGDVGLSEQVVVEGVLAFVISFSRRQADPNRMPEIIQNNLDVIDRCKRELCRPVSERRCNISDEELKDLMRKIKDVLDSCDSQRQEAENASHFLKQEAKNTFTDEFWESINIDI